jgi:hypothetical protein
MKSRATAKVGSSIGTQLKPRNPSHLLDFSVSLQPPRRVVRCVTFNREVLMKPKFLFVLSFVLAAILSSPSFASDSSDGLYLGPIGSRIVTTTRSTPGGEATSIVHFSNPSVPCGETISSCEALAQQGKSTLIHFGPSGTSFINPDLGKTGSTTVRACSYLIHHLENPLDHFLSGKWAPRNLEIYGIDCQMNIDTQGALSFSGRPAKLRKTVSVPEASGRKHFDKFVADQLRRAGCHSYSQVEGCETPMP